MNIDSSSLNSLLTSSGEGLEKLQQSLQADGMVSEEFADTLMEKIRQFNGTDESNDLSENIDINLLSDKEELQELAGLLDEKEMTTDSSNLLGNSLPIESKEEKEIDLESTLEILNNAINAVVEKVERIKTSEPEQVNQLGKAVKELQEIKLSIENNLKQIDVKDQKVDQVSDSPVIKEGLSSPVNLAERLDAVIDKVQQVMGFVSKENVLAEAEIKIESEIDTKAVDDKNIKVNVDLDDERKRLATELETIREDVTQTIAKKPNGKKQEINESRQPLEFRDEESDDELQIVNQIAAIVATMNEPLKAEQIVAESKVVTGQVLQEMKRDGVSIKQMPAEKSLESSVDDEPSDLLQQENKSGKFKQESPVITTKQNGKIENSSFKETELSNEKSVPKFATDLAMLNRAVIAENKTEIPPMTKHFAHPEWNKEMGERVIWMHKQEIPSAELRLNPKHLGPVTIKVDVTQDQATVAFTAQHAVVKEAIEAALPKLREMLSAQQLNLADVNVSQNDSGQRQAKDSNQMGSGAGDSKNKETNEMFNNEQAEQTMEIADEIEAGRAIASNGVLSIFA